MKLFKRSISILCVLVLCMSMVTPALAAKNVCTQLSGNASSKKTFTVTTTGNIFGGKIVLQQPKTRADMVNPAYSHVKKDIYCGYTVEIKKISGGNVKKADNRSIEWYCTPKCTIKSLQKNAVYQITIRYNKAHMWKYVVPYFNKWEKTPTWTALKTRGVSYCG